MIDPFEDLRLDGKVAVITGGASGIGAAAGELLAAAGCAVVLGDINGEGAQEVAGRISSEGGRAIGMGCDVRNKADLESLVDAAVSEFGRLDVLANVAGVLSWGMAITIEADEFDRVVAINQRSVLFGCQAALRVMIPQGSGSIINVSSGTIDMAARNQSLYAMTKAAVAMFSMELAVEVGEHGIRVNTIAPGQTATNFGRERRMNDHGEIDPAKMAAYFEMGAAISPIGLVGNAMDQAHLIHYLASDASRFATGAIFRANGGVGIVW